MATAERRPRRRGTLLSPWHVEIRCVLAMEPRVMGLREWIALWRRSNVSHHRPCRGLN